MDDDKPNDQLVREVAQSILDMDAANPDWFLEEAMKIRKLSLELELARHQQEKWKGTREERKSKFDSGRSHIKTINKGSAPLKSILKKRVEDTTVETPTGDAAPAAEPVLESSTVESSTISAGDKLVHLAGEVGDLSKEVTELWTFFPVALDSMTKRMEILRKDNNDLIEALEEQKQKNESLEKRLAEMEAWVAAQKKV
ncbi:hypothetical protein M436DRAFT_86010 [Aureobasidium namibiae CBS 147.97]|uniref:Uncharacterized protein n=1 Tax=Aureobasidium namibiae CBS 147.97 TaxID=1043004 RepID=A0A074WB84_9PEZI